MATLNLTPARIRVAKAIYLAGQASKVSPTGIEIAFMTTCVEATMLILASLANPASLNYPHDGVAAGDHDSVGPFQQRNAWGAMGERMDGYRSALLFFNGGHEGQRGLKDFPYTSGSRSKGQWAQAVQVSAFPDRYEAYDTFGDYVENLVSRLIKPAPHWNDHLPVYDTSDLVRLQTHPDGEVHNSLKNLQAALRIWSFKAKSAKVPGSVGVVSPEATGRWDPPSHHWAVIANRHKGFGSDGWFGPKGLAWLGAGRYHLLPD